MKSKMNDQEWEAIILFLMQHPLPNARVFMNENIRRGIFVSWNESEFLNNNGLILENYDDALNALQALVDKQTAYQNYLKVARFQGDIL